MNITRSRWFLAPALLSVLVLADVVPAWPGLAHQVALPPLDVLADQRLLLREAPSYPAFVAGLVLSILFRGLVLGNLRLVAIASVPGLVAAILTYSGTAVLYAPFWWAGVGLSLVIFLALVPIARWRALLYVVVLAGLGALAAPGWRAVVVMWLSSVLTVWAIRGRTGARAPAAALACVLLLVPSAQAEVERRDGTLFLVPGVATTSRRGALYRLDAADLGFTARQVHSFSYAGPPYRREDTQRPLGELVQAFRRQVTALDPPVTVVTHSQGAWIASAALTRHGDLGVRRLVMLGPYPTHPVAYTGVGEDAVRLLLWAVRRTGNAGGFDPGAPLARQLLATPGALDRVMRTALPRQVRALTVTAAADLPVMPAGWRSPVAADACPVTAWHSSLPTSRRVHRVVNRFLDDGRLGRCPWWRTALGLVSRPFGVP